MGGSKEDIQKIHGKLRALNSAPAPDNLDNVEALFDTLEKVAGMRRHRSVLLFWAGYTAGVLSAGLLALFLMG
ncbi:hypothetical protein LCGC14_0887230 [marine sediment metagenome]|uniref:Uncharacterized protein n=1 Tax=marine sediment metagenome TaxID=412755 RepID=A0A0F9PKY5_9ZZZZ